MSCIWTGRSWKLAALNTHASLNEGESQKRLRLFFLKFPRRNKPFLSILIIHLSLPEVAPLHGLHFRGLSSWANYGLRFPSTLFFRTAAGMKEISNLSFMSAPLESSGLTGNGLQMCTGLPRLCGADEYSRISSNEFAVLSFEYIFLFWCKNKNHDLVLKLYCYSFNNNRVSKYFFFYYIFLNDYKDFFRIF